MRKFLFLVSSLVVFTISSITAQKVGVDDDYYLNYPVSFSCPWPTPNVTQSTDDAADDDYYGTVLSAEYPAFVFFYSWMSFITVVPLLYFAFNNKISPVGEVKPFLPEGIILSISIYDISF
jgi:hypothetical protein